MNRCPSWTIPSMRAQPDAPRGARRTGNLLKHIKVRHGDVEQGFAEADVIVEREYSTPTTEHAFLEPECSIGARSRHRWARQADRVRRLADPLPGSRAGRRRRWACPEEQVRVIGTLIGGGFGGKEDIAGQIHVALLAQATGRPVKMLYTRQESLIFHPKRHATHPHQDRREARRHADRGARPNCTATGGAYASLSDKVMTRATTHATGPYDRPQRQDRLLRHVHQQHRRPARFAALASRSRVCRRATVDGFGRALDMDPIELRRMNAQRVGATTTTGQVLRESVGWRISTRWTRRCRPTRLIRPHPPFRWARGQRQQGVRLGHRRRLQEHRPGRRRASTSAGAEVEVYPTARSRCARRRGHGPGHGERGGAVAAEELGIPTSGCGAAERYRPNAQWRPDHGFTPDLRERQRGAHAATNMREAMSQVAAEHLDVPPGSVEVPEGRVRAQRNVSVDWRKW